jgi:hypothetical protein
MLKSFTERDGWNTATEMRNTSIDIEWFYAVTWNAWQRGTISDAMMDEAQDEIDRLSGERRTREAW